MRDVSKIREALYLNFSPWSNIPDKLLLQAFDRTNLQQFNKLELRGDRILEVIATNLLFEEKEVTASQVATRKQELVRNTTLFCIMNSLDLCCQIKGAGNTMKNCADSFEAVLGVMYNYLHVTKKDPTAMNQVEKYIRTYWFTPSLLRTVSSGGRADNCTYKGLDVRDGGKERFIDYCPPVRVVREDDSDDIPEVETMLNSVSSTDRRIPVATEKRIAELLRTESWRQRQLVRYSLGQWDLLDTIYTTFKYPLEYDILHDELSEEEEQIPEYTAVLYTLNLKEMMLDQVLGTGSTVEEALYDAKQQALSQLMEYLKYNTP